MIAIQDELQTTLARVLQAYLDELHEADIPEPLRQRFTLAAVLDDLCRLAGVDPASVLE